MIVGVLGVVVVTGAVGAGEFAPDLWVVGVWASGVDPELEVQPPASKPVRTSGTIMRFTWITARLYTGPVGREWRNG
ncbi:MAG TPA: hypothetical protein VLX59_13570 [Acidimicrobiales bacterium]|nr:hypothetical protein [Acidimicrobiales bacterium]